MEIAIASNKLEQSLSKWTIVASILIPLNVVAGFFGMNVKVPGNDQPTLTYWWTIIASMVVYTALMVAISKYKRLF